MARKGPFCLALGISLASLVLSLQLPEVLQDALDEALVARSRPLSRFVWLAAALAVGTSVCSLVARQLMMRVAYGLEYDLRNMVYAHLTRMPSAFYARHPAGQLFSRASSDLRAIQLYLAFGPFVLVQCLGAAIAFGFMLRIDVPLACTSILVVPLVGWAAIRLQRALLPASWLVQNRLAEVTSVVDESITGAQVIRSFGREQAQVTALDRASRRLTWAYVTDADIRARLTPVVQNLGQVGMVVVVLLGGHRVLQGDLEVGAILAFSTYVFLLQGPFQMLGTLVVLGQRAAASAERVYEILDATSSVVEDHHAQPLQVTSGTVVLDDVSFGYDPDHPVLRGVTLQLRRGESMALVGRSGSGKSTLARLLSREYDPTHGSICVDGTDIKSVTIESIRSAVDVVPEEPFLFSTSIRDNIAYGLPDASEDEVRRAARAAGADHFVSALADGYDTVIGERGQTLSGGQRQRLTVARSLLRSAPILVLDDSTSSLDVETEAAIHRTLKASGQEKTVLFIAHRLSTITSADRVAVLWDGQIVAEGSHEELLERSPEYVDILAHVHSEEVALGEDVPAQPTAPSASLNGLSR